MSDAEFDATVANIDRNLGALHQFLRDCDALTGIAARYPAGTKLGNAVAHAARVFMDKAVGLGGYLDPLDATEPRT